MIEKTDQTGCSTTTEFTIELEDVNCKPVCHDVRRTSGKKLEFPDEEVAKFLQAGIIEPILTNWWSGIVIVAKPGHGDDLGCALIM